MKQYFAGKNKVDTTGIPPSPAMVEITQFSGVDIKNALLSVINNPELQTVVECPELAAGIIRCDYKKISQNKANYLGKFIINLIVKSEFSPRRIEESLKRIDKVTVVTLEEDGEVYFHSVGPEERRLTLVK